MRSISDNLLKNQSFQVLGEELSREQYPVLYRWSKSNPETLNERLKELAEKLYEGGSVGSAAQALESDLEYSQ
ncbi:hypothetical protein A3H11_01100 [Candidatus Uhrbacteria bacterium RIFCSPLOWO2_12_FULL_47_10]|nr:MAG: hypothetical protein A2753_04415 [Candidatus Uhrbacteria bacterium RIFCSPHIGHO2_01_FULL_47_11]OGL84027.1 MAG: hypothetical protein A3J03_00020 [Candidatus Uhrbacteria bacterium RIFCSPLOWO2_02_FULL_46_25]OGL91916.1 MAG: hypothetical protein A3H11_01100 [Candidatus Uhrbacteria bacterium RIFCSPLOWO2_12_FULL_47_10]